MPQETVGFVNLEWTCQRCGSKDPGTTKICAGCGNVMSETDKFELPAQQELIKDEAVIAKAERWKLKVNALGGVVSAEPAQ